MKRDIPAKPFAFALEKGSAALVIIDMQRDFIEPGGFGESLGNRVERLHAIVPTVATLLAGFRRAAIPVIHTRECHLPDLSNCPPAKRNRGNPALRIGDHGPMGRVLVAGEIGAEIIPELQPVAGEIVIDKPGKGAFYRTDLESMLHAKSITQLVLCGVTTEVCVQTTMREANDRGFDCLLASDATESYFPHFKESTLEMIVAQGGIVGWTAGTADILEALNA